MAVNDREATSSTRRLAIELLRVLEARALHLTVERALGDLRRRRVIPLGLAADQLRQAHHPGQRVVALVPDEPERAAGPQDACDLGERDRRVEPVKRLTCDHRVGGTVEERNRLGRPFERDGTRHGGAQLLCHLLQRLDGDDVIAERGQLTRQLAGARAEVDHPPGIAGEPGDRVARIPGTRAFVQIGDAAERGRAASKVVVAQTRPLSERIAST